MSVIALARLQYLGITDYTSTWRSMKDFTSARTRQTPDTIQVLQHIPTYTLGMNGDPTHIPNPGDIPIVHSDRGGQATYHGPGQLVIYPLLDLKRSGLTVKGYVRALEQAVIDLLADLKLNAHRLHGAPGVYVEGAKVASLGVRIRRGYSYHGLALNVNMDLTPFQSIRVCGIRDLRVTQLADLDCPLDIGAAADLLLEKLLPVLYGKPKDTLIKEGLIDSSMEQPDISLPTA
ncbi:MAG: lipoyl(octanoyl) transferase LipB [Candidatus Eutrophobiaceae bacterium]